MTTQNLWDAVKALLKGKFIAIQAHLKIQGKKNQVNNLTLHIKQPEKEQEAKPKVYRRRGIIKIRAEIKEIETNKIVAKINESKS